MSASVEGPLYLRLIASWESILERDSCLSLDELDDDECRVMPYCCPSSDDTFRDSQFYGGYLLTE